MKKIYSFVLMACALLLCTNVSAGNHVLTSALQWDEVWQDVATNGGKITLNCDPTISDFKYYWLGTQNMNDAAKTVELDLNGHVMTLNGQFLLTHGTLRITGAGGEINGTSSKNLFYVTGSTNKDVDPSVDGANYFTHLYIGEGVTVRQSSTGYKATIRIEEIYGGSDAQVAREESKSVPTKVALTYATNIFVVPYMSGTTETATSRNYQNKGVAYGVRVDVHGTVEGQKYGVQTGGYLGCKAFYDDKMANLDARFNPNNVELVTTKPFYAQVKDSKDAGSYAVENIKNHVFGANDDATYSSFVHIYPTGVVKALENYTNSDEGNPFGIYAGGYGRWKVEGYVTGNTGALVKSGIVDFENATVEGTGSTYAAANNSTSGSKASGSGIVISTEDSYVGETQVSIKGDSYIAADHGYALQEIITTQNGEGDSKVEAITIDGGTFAGGKVGEDPNTGKPIEGTITITETTATGTVTINGLSVTGTGSYITQEDDGVSIGGKTLEEYFSSIGGGIHITTVPDGDDTYTYVITPGPAPVAGNWVSKLNDGVTPRASIDSASVKWQVNSSDEIAANLVLKELEINDTLATGEPRDQVLTIKSGATLEVGRVILGSNAQIVVEAGAKLIVTGKYGIVASKTGNIVLQHNSETNQYATFVFDPEVSSNKHPNATVEFTSNSWRESSTSLQWEWFGVPTHNAVKSIAATCPAFVSVYENNDWSDIGLISDIDGDPEKLAKLNKPFAAYDLLANRLPDADAPEITITGELVGNVDGVLKADKRWNPFANSYTAEIDAEALVSTLSSSENIAAAVYVATQNNDGSITWDAKPIAPFNKVHGIMLRPMQAFMLNNNRYVEDATINYASMVYAPATASAAPRRSAVENGSIITINVANENGGNDDVDLCESNAESFVKYMNSDINIYVLADEKQDIFAASDLENTYVGFSTVKGGKFTISFTKAEGREFDLIDLDTNARVAVSEGETYSFTAAANSSNDYRFKLVERQNAPTAIENTEAAKNVKGIYTITGQFVGEMNVWNTLPAGVYVVNGEKCVK